MDQNDLRVGKEFRPFRTVFRDDWENGQNPTYFSIACMHCENAPCVLACPVGCLYKDGETGLTLFDNENCIGCHSCALACPFGAPVFGEDQKMKKCDGCVIRIREELEPACVRACAFGALRLVREKGDEVKEEWSLAACCERLI